MIVMLRLNAYKILSKHSFSSLTHLLIQITNVALTHTNEQQFQKQTKWKKNARWKNQTCQNENILTINQLKRPFMII